MERMNIKPPGYLPLSPSTSRRSSSWTVALSVAVILVLVTVYTIQRWEDIPLIGNIDLRGRGGRQDDVNVVDEEKQAQGDEDSSIEGVRRKLKGARHAALCTQRSQRKLGHIEHAYNVSDVERIKMLAEREANVKTQYSRFFTTFSHGGGKTSWNDVVGHGKDSTYTRLWKALTGKRKDNNGRDISVRVLAKQVMRMYYLVNNPNMESLNFTAENMGPVGGVIDGIGNEDDPQLIWHPQGATHPIEDGDNGADEPPLLVMQDSFFNGGGYVLKPTRFRTIARETKVDAAPYSVGGGVKEHDWPEDSHMGCQALADDAVDSVRKSCKEWDDGAQFWACSPKAPYDTVLMLTQHHCTTFYHSFTEFMTRLLAFYDIYVNNPNMKVAYTDSGVSDGFLDLIGVPDYRRIHLAGDEWSYANTLLVPPPLRQTEKNTRIYGQAPDLATGALLRSVYLSKENVSIRPYILFMSRSSAQYGNDSCEGTRCVANEPAVIAAFKKAFGDKYDVHVFRHNDGLSSAVKYFGASPRYIVGVHGAGWQNLAFCKTPKQRKGSPLYAVHISSEFRRDFYKPLAESVGARYVRYFVPNVEHYSSNHTVNTESLIGIFKQIEDGSFNFSVDAYFEQRDAVIKSQEGTSKLGE
eukprot:Plantae.Rhodophyta-Hildenbrandia_rubra.ctg14444.p1 GENE.Plantae.Rhodophyta-Hildenbrandia_rubra.ctg14444~~Plantae.Rhodophyta-Hildenbrandia_rubra.ctg14444.p1  ORF type:complete len:637 (+),score=82.00 Plantae.Rhodophyta-Hildenbrandia_rubra.ctg14444:266-2176(+)